MPVKIRKAAQHMAMFSVDADAAQQMIDYSGLQVCRYLPGRAIVVLMLMRYIDGDLGEYYEYGTNVMVNPPRVERRAGPRALGSAGAFIHHLPVDQEFTLEAGRRSGAFRRSWPTSRFVTATSSASTSPSMASSRSGWISAPVCRSRCRDVRRIRRRTRTVDGVTREIPSR